MLLAFIIMSGCAWLQQAYPKPADPVCARPEYAESVICACGRYLGLEAEQMSDMFLDATLVPVAIRQVKAEQMQKAVSKVRRYVEEKDVLTMEGITTFLAEQSRTDPALAMMLSRRLPKLATIPGLSVQPFQKIDKAMVLVHLDYQEQQFSYLVKK
jgi:hypothetical protein